MATVAARTMRSASMRSLVACTSCARADARAQAWRWNSTLAAARAAPCRAALPALAPSQPRAPREVFAERSFHSSRRAQQDAPEGGAVAAAVGDGDLDGVLNDLPVVEKQFSEKIARLADEIVALNLLEASDLADALKERLGIDEAESFMPMGFGGGGGAPGGQAGGAGGEAAAEEVEEKTHVDIKLAAFDAKAKIKVIKEVRAVTGLGLKEAKALVESAPATLMPGVKVEEAEGLKAKLEEVGATIELD